ncbi:MAG: TMEM175 family protein, partial [bacterium]
FIPFPTRVLAEHLTSANDKVAATAFSGASVTVTGVMFNLLWRYATAGRRLLRPTVSDWVINAINRRYNPGPLVYLVATVLAFVSVPLSLALIIGLPVLYLLPYRPPSVEP